MCRKLKINLLFLLLLIPLSINALSKPMAVAGSFYPNDKDKLSINVKKLLENAHKYSQQDVNAIIVPHAGYIFSADVAASAYAMLNKKYKNIFIIGSSHSVDINKASIYSIGNYVTPLGQINSSNEIISSLMEHPDLFTFEPQAHFKEHTIEVQLPFLQTIYGNDLSIVPIIIATSDIKTIKAISEILKPYFNDDNLFIISSDLSHYPSYKDANKIDKLTINAILNNNPLKFVKALMRNEKSLTNNLDTSACGWSSILTLLNLTQNSNYKYKLLTYKNSGDTKYGDKNRVVGYSAIQVYKEKKRSFDLSAEEKKELLDIAKLTLYKTTLEKKKPQIDESKISPKLKQHIGAFVTLEKNGKLRGCIGRFEPNEPLYKVIVNMTVNSAKHDSRFNPVTSDELKDIDIELSVLTPRKRIHSLDKIVIGKHGIFIQKGQKSGTFLPQVAIDMNWGVEEFVGYCAQDKAKIGFYGYKDAKIYIFEAIVF